MQIRFTILFILVAFSFNYCFCQGNTMVVKGGIDTTKNVEWVEVPYSPEMILKSEIEHDRSDLIVVLFCDSTLYTIVTSNTFIVQHCVDQLHTNNQNKDDSSGTKYVNCLLEYFADNQAKYKIDTLWVANDLVIDEKKIAPLSEKEATYFMTQMELYDSDSSYFYKTEFYKVSEMKGICISGEANFRVKNIETWERGKKHGKWKYFDLTGKLTQLVEYKYGIIIQDVSY